MSAVNPMEILKEAVERASNAIGANDEGIQFENDGEEALAAVAKLIEKVEELLSTHGVYHCYGGSGESIEGRMHAELTAALARCRGAQ